MSHIVARQSRANATLIWESGHWGDVSRGNEYDPQEAFALLDHSLRIDILLALLDHWRAAETEPQRYSDLMRAVGLEDSGKFNYHLKQLRGVYLRKTAGGYVPTASATALYRAVLANRPTEEATPTLADPDVACPDCESSLTATHERGFFTLDCPACEGFTGRFSYPFPKNGLDGRTGEEILRAVSRRARAEIGLARAGQCPDCAGPTTVRLVGETHDVEISCESCRWLVEVGYLLPLLSDTRVISALTDIGVPVESSYFWELPDPAISTGPETVELAFESDDRTAAITVTDDLDVLSVSVDS